MLPRCPKTWEKDIGTGTLTGYDYSKPNCVLYKKDILKLLGKPDRNSNNQKWYYWLRPPGSRICEMTVDFGAQDYAISSSVAEYEKPR